MLALVKLNWNTNREDFGMKKLFKGTLNGIKNSVIRFPLTIGVSTVCVILLIYISETTSGANNDYIETLGRITMVIALGIPLSLCTKLFFERIEGYKKVSLYTSYIVGAVLLVFYYFFLLRDVGMVSVSRYVGFSLILYIMFLLTLYLPNSEDFEIVVVGIFTRFFTTILYSLVLYLGLAAILFTIDKLLGINIKGEIYYYTCLIVAGIFAPSFFLAGIKGKKRILTLNDYSKLLNILILYIVMPLITVYTIILYIYFGKIIITRQWPEGLVSHLVLWYSVISACILFFISPMIHEKIWPRKYMKYFPKTIIPLIIMMFISIGIRIRSYGVTENRYFVVALGIWVFLVMIYFSTAKKLKNVILPLSLAVIITISVFGPISSYSVSKHSQNKRLNKIFVKNNMIKGNKIIKANTKITNEDAKQITSILNYFDKKHSLRDISELPQDFKTSNMEKDIGVKYTEEYNENNNGYFSFNSLGASELMNIKGYDYFFDSRNSQVRQQQQINTTLSINFDNQLSTLKITKDGKDIYKKDLQGFANTLMNKYGINQNQQNISSREMLFEDENDKAKIKIQFYNISGSRNTTSDKIESVNFEFYLVFKVK